MPRLFDGMSVGWSIGEPVSGLASFGDQVRVIDRDEIPARLQNVAVELIGDTAAEELDSEHVSEKPAFADEPHPLRIARIPVRVRR